MEGMKLRTPLLAAALAAAAALASCGGTSSAPGSCTDGSTLTYATFGQAFMSSYCVSCHGGGRIEAGVVLTSQSAIQNRASQVSAAAGTGGSMPPSGSAAPSSAERAKLA